MSTEIPFIIVIRNNYNIKSNQIKSNYWGTTLKKFLIIVLKFVIGEVFYGKNVDENFNVKRYTVDIVIKKKSTEKLFFM